MVRHKGPYARAFVALRRLSRSTQSEMWKWLFRTGWTARTAPPKWRIEADYDTAIRSARRWQDHFDNSMMYGHNRKYTLRCNRHALMYGQWAAILRQLLDELDTLGA